MSAPLNEADYLRLPKRYSTKEEVLAMLKEHVSNGFVMQKETREERMDRKLYERHASAVFHANTLAGPVWQLVGPVRPVEYVEERLRNYIGRYGQTRND